MRGSRLKYTSVGSPLGELLLLGDETGLCGLYMESQKYGRCVDPSWQRDDEALAAVANQLGAYFAGKLARFDVPLSLGGTEFQGRVWSALAQTPLGTTLSYGELARRAGASGSARAVGAAVGRNPISIIVPCHRIVGSDGSLTGYAGGLERKRWLLEHEGAMVRSERVGGIGGTNERPTVRRRVRAAQTA